MSKGNGHAPRTSEQLRQELAELAEREADARAQLDQAVRGMVDNLLGKYRRDPAGTKAYERAGEARDRAEELLAEFRRVRQAFELDLEMARAREFEETRRQHAAEGH